MVGRRHPISEERYEASFLEGPLPVFFGSHTLTCKAGWEGVCDTLCRILNGF